MLPRFVRVTIDGVEMISQVMDVEIHDEISDMREHIRRARGQGTPPPRQWVDWRDFADADFGDDWPPLDAYTAPPPDYHTVPRETPMGEIGYAPSIVEDVESCWRCTTGAVVEEDLGLCSDCITTLREANE